MGSSGAGRPGPRPGRWSAKPGPESVPPPGSGTPSPANGANVPTGPALTAGEATAAAAAAAATQKGTPFWAEWGRMASQQGAILQQQAAKSWADLQLQAKQFKMPKKLQMPVHVDVDFLNPTIDTVKTTVGNAWAQLPPPVQLGAPYIAAGALTTFIVFKVKQNQLEAEQEQSRKLRMQMGLLKKDNQELHKRFEVLKGRMGSLNTATELKMAAAVANATQAAAQAAEAAASAATACAIVRK